VEVEKQKEKKIKIGQFAKFLQEEGIVAQYTMSGTP